MAVSTRYLGVLPNAIEKFDQVRQAGGAALEPVDPLVTAASFLLFVIAFQLCWTRNAGEPVITRVVYAVVAGTLGLLYIMWYALTAMWFPDCVRTTM